MLKILKHINKNQNTAMTLKRQNEPILKGQYRDDQQGMELECSF